MAKSKHVHRYMATRTRGGEKLWRCSLPGCGHFIPLNISVEGRFSLCWDCGEQFIMDNSAMNDDMPKCIDCRIQAISVQPTRTHHESAESVEVIRTPPTEQKIDKHVSYVDGVQRTPEQQKLYEREMREMFGPDWWEVLNAPTGIE